MSSSQSSQQPSAAASSSTTLDTVSAAVSGVVSLINAIPNIIRDNTIYSTKVVGANMQALTDVISGAPNPKNPPVTKDNMTIIAFLESKQTPLYSKIKEHAQKIKELPSEKRTIEVVKFANESVKPVIKPQ